MQMILAATHRKLPLTICIEAYETGFSRSNSLSFSFQSGAAIDQGARTPSLRWIRVHAPKTRSRDSSEQHIRERILGGLLRWDRTDERQMRPHLHVRSRYRPFCVLPMRRLSRTGSERGRHVNRISGEHQGCEGKTTTEGQLHMYLHLCGNDALMLLPSVELECSPILIQRIRWMVMIACNDSNARLGESLSHRAR
jgi:hypothetical protein